MTLYSDQANGDMKWYWRTGYRGHCMSALVNGGAMGNLISLKTT